MFGDSMTRRTLVSLDGFAQAMKEAGHFTFRCPVENCRAVMWLEADDLESLEGFTLMRFGHTPAELCRHCLRAQDLASNDEGS